MDTHLIQVLPGVTNLAFVRHAQGDRIFVGRRSGVRDQYRWQNIPEHLLRSQALVHTTVDGHVDDLLPRLQAWQIPVTYDFSKKFASHHERLLPYLRVAFASGAHLSEQEAQDLARHWVSLGAAWAVITRGEYGSLGFDGQRFVSQDIQPVSKVTDTLGCGDAFIAGMIHALANGQDIQNCLLAGSQVAADAAGIQGGYGHGVPLSQLELEAVLPVSAG